MPINWKAKILSVYAKKAEKCLICKCIKGFASFALGQQNNSVQLISIGMCVLCGDLYAGAPVLCPIEC